MALKVQLMYGKHPIYPRTTSEEIIDPASEERLDKIISKLKNLSGGWHIVQDAEDPHKYHLKDANDEIHGTIVVPGGGGDISGAVRYDEAQSLTSVEQARALDNIKARGLTDLFVYEPCNVHWTWTAGTNCPEDFVAMANAAGAPKPVFNTDATTGEGSWGGLIYFNPDGTIKYMCQVKHGPDLTPNDTNLTFTFEYYGQHGEKPSFLATAKRESATDITPVRMNASVLTTLDFLDAHTDEYSFIMCKK